MAKEKTEAEKSSEDRINAAVAKEHKERSDQMALLKTEMSTAVAK